MATANSIINPTWVMKEIGRLLVNNLVFTGTVARSYDPQYEVQGAKVGLSVNARLPQRYIVTKGQAMTPHPVDDVIVPIELTDQAHVGIEFSSISETMQVDNYREKYIMPAVTALTHTMDLDGMERCTQATYMTVGTPGVVPGSTGTLPQAAYDVYLAAGVKLHKGAVPVDDRVAMLDPQMHATLVSAGLTIFNPSKLLSDVYREGMFGAKALGIDEWYMTQQVYVHTVGPLGGVPLVNGAGQTGSVLNVKGFTASGLRLNKGDVIQAALVRMVNPMTYVTTGQLEDFVVQANVSADGSGNAAVPIDPPIITEGNRKTVTGSPADGAAITIFNDPAAHANKVSPTGLVYHPDAYACVMADLILPQKQWISERIGNTELGVAVRFVKAYDIRSDQAPARVDILYGWKAVRPEMACRIQS